MPETVAGKIWQNLGKIVISSVVHAFKDKISEIIYRNKELDEETSK